MEIHFNKTNANAQLTRFVRGDERVRRDFRRNIIANIDTSNKQIDETPISHAIALRNFETLVQNSLNPETYNASRLSIEGLRQWKVLRPIIDILVGHPPIENLPKFAKLVGRVGKSANDTDLNPNV